MNNTAHFDAHTTMQQITAAIDQYDGLIKKYVKPFSTENHDALSSSDYIFTYFNGDEILPLTN